MKKSQKIIRATGVQLILILLFGLLTSLFMYQFNEDYNSGVDPNPVIQLDPVLIKPEPEIWPEHESYYLDDIEEEPKIEEWMFDSDFFNPEENVPTIEVWMCEDPVGIHSL